MVKKLSLISFTRGFSLIEVVIALFIISITFLGFSQLLEQNLRSQEIKKDYLDQHYLKTSVLTIYVANPKIDNSQIEDLLSLDKISERQLSRYNSLMEVEIEFSANSNTHTIKILK